MSRKRVLVLLDKHSAGEALRLRPLVGDIKAGRPGSDVVLVVPASVASFFRQGIEADRIVVSLLAAMSNSPSMRSRKLVELLRLLLRIGLGYDEAFILGWGSTLLDVLARMAARRTIGYTHRWPWLVSKPLGAYIIEDDLLEQAHRILRFAYIPIRAEPASGELSSDADATVVARLLEGERIPEVSLIVALHAGSDWACQQWSAMRWAALADRLVIEYGAVIVFTGLDEEKPYVDYIRSLMRSRSVSLVGATTIAQLCAFMKRCSLCITVDSATYELAQLANVPTVVLSSPTSPAVLSGSSSEPRVINMTQPGVRAMIIRCQFWHINGPITFDNQCHDYRCRFAGMPSITVDHVMHEIADLPWAVKRTEFGPGDRDAVSMGGISSGM